MVRITLKEIGQPRKFIELSGEECSSILKNLCYNGLPTNCRNSWKQTLSTNVVWIFCQVSSDI